MKEVLLRYGRNFSKIARTFLLSYIIVLVIPISFGSIAYMKAVDIVSYESSALKLSALRKLSSDLDSKLHEVEMVASQISMDYAVNNFLQVNAPLSNSDRYDVTRVIKELNPYFNSKSFYDDFFVYFPKANVIINHMTMYYPQFFYESVLTFSSSDEIDGFSRFLGKKYYRQYYFLREPVQYKNTFSKEVVLLLQSIPAWAKEPQAVLVMMIDKQKLANFVGSLYSEDFTYILNKDGKKIFSMEDTKLSMGVPAYDELNKKEDIIYRKISGVPYVMSYTTSAKTGWKYVTVSPEAVFFSKATEIRNIMFVFVIVCSIFGLITAYLLSNRQYSFVSKISGILSEWIGRDFPLRKGNELEYIGEATAKAFDRNRKMEQELKKLLMENTEYKERLNRNYNMVRNGLLTKLINGNIDNYAMVEGWFSSYNISFPYEKFCVLLFHIENCSQFIKNNSADEWDLLRFTLTSISEEIINTRHKGYLAELEKDKLVMIVNCKDEINFREEESIYQTVTTIKHFIEEHFKIYLSIAIGTIKQGIQSIQESYLEAAQSMNYKIIRGNSSIIRFSSINSVDKEYYYPIEIELKLINNVKAGDMESSNKLLEHIFYENFNRKKLTLKLVNCLFFDIMSTAIKTLDGIDIDYTVIFSKDFDPVDQLIRCETVKEMYDTISDIYFKICRYVRNYKNRSNMNLKDKIVNYIEDNYMKEGLSQSAIASEFNISTSFLSNFFKQQMGINMLDYINQLKVQKAKEILKNQSVTISEVALQVGYSSDKTLIRIFKQYEGITPGKYREINMVNQPTISRA